MNNTLTTDRNKSGHLLTQYFEGNTVELISTYKPSKDFVRLTYKAWGPVWLTIIIDNIRKGRNYQTLVSIDKKQLERLISNLQELNKQINY